VTGGEGHRQSRMANSTALNLRCVALKSLCDCVLSGCGWCPSDLTCRPAGDPLCGACFRPPQSGECVDVDHAAPLAVAALLFVAPVALWFIYARLWRLRHNDWAFTRTGTAVRKFAWLVPQPWLVLELAKAKSTGDALVRLFHPARRRLGCCCSAEKVTTGRRAALARLQTQSDRATAAAHPSLEAGGVQPLALALARGMSPAAESPQALEDACKASLNAKAAVPLAAATVLNLAGAVAAGLVGDAISAWPVVLLCLAAGIRASALLQSCLPRTPALRVSRINAFANVTSLAAFVAAVVGSGVLDVSGLCAPLVGVVVVGVGSVVPGGYWFSISTRLLRPGPDAVMLASFKMLHISSDAGGDGAGGGGGGGRQGGRGAAEALLAAEEAAMESDGGSDSCDDDDQRDAGAAGARGRGARYGTSGRGRRRAQAASEGTSGWIRVSDWVPAEELVVLCWSMGVVVDPETLESHARRGARLRRRLAVRLGLADVGGTEQGGGGAGAGAGRSGASVVSSAVSSWGAAASAPRPGARPDDEAGDRGALMSRAGSRQDATRAGGAHAAGRAGGRASFASATRSRGSAGKGSAGGGSAGGRSGRGRQAVRGGAALGASETIEERQEGAEEEEGCGGAERERGAGAAGAAARTGMTPGRKRRGAASGDRGLRSVAVALGVTVPVAGTRAGRRLAGQRRGSLPGTGLALGAGGPAGGGSRTATAAATARSALRPAPAPSGRHGSAAAGSSVGSAGADNHVGLAASSAPLPPRPASEGCARSRHRAGSGSSAGAGARGGPRHRPSSSRRRSSSRGSSASTRSMGASDASGGSSAQSRWRRATLTAAGMATRVEPGALRTPSKALRQYARSRMQIQTAMGAMALPRGRPPKAPAQPRPRVPLSVGGADEGAPRQALDLV